MYYKVGQAFLQSGANSITKFGSYYKKGQYNLPGDGQFVQIAPTPQM